MSETIAIGDYVRCYGDRRCAELTGEVVSIGRVNLKVQTWYNPGGLSEPTEQIHIVAIADVKETRRAEGRQ